MGAIVVLTPVVVAAWPVLAGAIASAAASLGYASVESLREQKSREAAKESKGIELEVPGSEVVTGQLGREQRIRVTRDGVTITFQRDERGKASLCVLGEGRSHDELRALGEEMSRRVVRDYVYQQIMSEVRARDYIVVDESVDENNAIHLTVRHWEH
jgi:hypothetical protein